MSKSEILEHLETLTPDDLDEVLERAAILRDSREPEGLTPYEEEILSERMAEYKRDGDKGEPADVVMARIRAKLKR